MLPPNSAVQFTGKFRVEDMVTTTINTETAYHKTHPALLVHIIYITMRRWKLNSEPDYGLDIVYDYPCT